MSKHTPGPWAFRLEESSRFTLFVEGQEIEEIVSGCGCCDSPWCSIENARLIAAAPDLLEALRSALEWYGPDDVDKPTWGRLARAAIAKAEGTA